MAEEKEGAPRWQDRIPEPTPERVVLLAGILLALSLALLLAWSELKRPADVSNESVPFRASQDQPTERIQKGKEVVTWPTFRLNRQRTGYLPIRGLRPPFERIWRYGGKPLLEFPPVIAAGKLFFVDNDGHAIALDAETGKKVWTRRIARLNASSPTFSRGRLYIVNLEPGQVVALDAETGRPIWKRPLPCRSESSPIVVRGLIFFGCEDGSLYAKKTSNGKTRWRTSLGGAIKAAPAYRMGTLFVGDYGGLMNAVRARDGRILWQSSSLGPGLGRAGSFYSTPAVAFGRVYSGNNDGRVYSFDSQTGELAWSFSTGGWVYSGPAVASVPGTKPSVYIGSFDGNVYALDARDGGLRWSFDMGGRVIGSLSVIGRIVYASTFDGTSTYGLGVRKGNRRFTYFTGAYMPAVSDGQRLYIVGYSSIHALEPVPPSKAKRPESERNGKPSVAKQPRN